MSGRVQPHRLCLHQLHQDKAQFGIIKTPKDRTPSDPSQRQAHDQKKSRTPEIPNILGIFLWVGSDLQNTLKGLRQCCVARFPSPLQKQLKSFEFYPFASTSACALGRTLVFSRIPPTSRIAIMRMRRGTIILMSNLVQTCKVPFDIDAVKCLNV